LWFRTRFRYAGVFIVINYQELNPMNKQHMSCASLLVLVAVLGGCSKQAETTAADPAAAAPAVAVTPQTPAQPERNVEPAPVVCASCGVVRSISAVTQQGTATGVGAALGAIVGGVAGNQVGGGSGQKIATVAGAIGGAVLGNNIEKNRSTSTYYEVTIDMEGGGQQFITVPDAAGISVGSKVEVQGSNIYLR
jgi:outer membrane lipoprotein SlyB